MSSLQKARSRRAATLLEVLLTLVIGSIVMLAIGAALFQQLRGLDGSRDDVEQAQLARAVLRMIADDLRSGVRYQPQDTSGTSDTLSGSLTAGLEGASAADLALAGDLEAEFGSSTSSTSSESQTPDVAGSTEPPPIPGLYGNSTALQIDSSRLPRIDQYQQQLIAQQNGEVPDPVSDMKTVAYYVLGQVSATAEQVPSINTTGTGGVGTVAGGAMLPGGLVRRQLDRAVTQFAAEQGDISILDRQGQILAPEAVAIYFDYFDGTEWAMEWDSDLRGGIPLAVKITLVLAPAAAIEEAGAALVPEDQLSVYQLVVHLPAAQPTSADAGVVTESTEENTSEESSGDGSSGGGR